MAPRLLTATTRILQIKVELTDVRPAVWRRVLVPDLMTLAEFHEVIREVLGRLEEPAHEFEVDAQRFGVPDPEDPDEDVLDEAKATLGLVASVGSMLFYLVDDEHCWSHTLTVETSTPPETGARYPRCVAGARLCPPDDGGGPVAFDPRSADRRLEPMAWVNGS